MNKNKSQILRFIEAVEKIADSIHAYTRLQYAIRERQLDKDFKKSIEKPLHDRDGIRHCFKNQPYFDER